jgi:translation initiation factor eIF-2B subunit epsilon
MHEVRVAMLSAILSKAHAAQPDKVNLSIKHLVTRWSELLLRTISENTRKEDCLDMLLSLQQICMPIQMSTLFVPTLKFMYDCEVIQEDSIMAWFHDPKSSIDEAARDIRGKATGFVTWLQNAEEATSDESD